MKNMKKLSFAVSGLLVTSLFLSACSAGTTTPGGGGGQKVSEVKIGHLHPLSGSSALEGKQMKDAIQLAVDEVNKAGGIKSLGGAKVVLLDGDHEGSPEKGVAETQRLIREGAVGILGTYMSGVALAATQEAERQKTPFVITIGVADDIQNRGFKYSFRVQPNASNMAKNFLDYIKKLKESSKAEINTIALVHEDSVFGSGIAKYIAEHAGEAGLKVAVEIPYSAKAADLSSEVNKLKAANPDIVVSTTYLRDGTLLFKTMKEAGVKSKAIVGVANGAISNAKFISDETAINQYLMDVNYTANPKNPKTAEVKKAYKDKTGVEMSPNAVYAYEAAVVLINAIERAGSTDKTKIRDALAATNLTDHILPQGPIVFDEKGENKNANAVLSQITDGKSKVVFPKEYSEADPVFPFPANK